MSSAICFNLDQSKIVSSGNGLNNTISTFTRVILFGDNNLNLPENERIFAEAHAYISDSRSRFGREVDCQPHNL